MNKRLPIQLAVGLIIIIALIVGGAFYFMGKEESMEKEFKETEVLQVPTIKKEVAKNSDKEEYEFSSIALPGVKFQYDLLANSVVEKTVDASDSCILSFASVGNACGPSYKYYSLEIKDKFKWADFSSTNSSLKIYPLEEYKSYLKYKLKKGGKDSISNTLSNLNDNLDSLLLEDAAKEIFPIPNAARGLLAHPKFINLKDGFGVRAVYYYTQAFEPPTNGRFFYSFLGLTKDKKYLISFKVYLFSPNLKEFYNNNQSPKPSYSTDKNNEQAKKYKAYVDSAFKAVESEKEGNFLPSILLLDKIVESIEVIDNS